MINILMIVFNHGLLTREFYRLPRGLHKKVENFPVESKQQKIIQERPIRLLVFIISSEIIQDQRAVLIKLGLTKRTFGS